jgi:methylase of polypeptide subunit release factors
MSGQHDEQGAALLALLRWLDEASYDFVAPTPDTHARVLARPRPQRSTTLRDVFGWSRDFRPGELPQSVVDLLDLGGALEREGERLRSTLRASRLKGRLFLHSAYPTDAADSVFFGPDTYRFADFIEAELPGGAAPGRLVDIGAGSGAGAITAAAICRVGEVVMTDINPAALRLAGVNAEHAGIRADAVLADGLEGVDGGIDLALANPPYIVDDAERTYRHGGDLHGGQLSLEMSVAAMDRLAPGGRLLLYTGAAIVDGANPLLNELKRLASERDCEVAARELDPDVFGEELSRPEYAEVDRIAVIGAVVRRPR